MAEQIEGAGKSRKALPYVVAAVAVVLSTSQGDSHMGAMIFPYGSGYRFFMESVFDNNGETFWGYYVGTISKDHKRMTIIGSADNGIPPA